jgi:hypothetical protein
VVAANLGSVLVDRWDEFGERGGDAQRRRSGVSEFVVAAAEILDECVAGDDHLCGAIGPQAPHRAEPMFEPSMVGLDRIVRVPLDVVPGRRDKLVEHDGGRPRPRR